jgi:phosphatidylglycerol lysyltransferase
VERSWAEVSTAVEHLVQLDGKESGGGRGGIASTWTASEPVTGNPRPFQATDGPWSALRQHGDFTLAYNTATQEGLEYFWSGNSYIAYRSYKGHVFALGDPVAAREQLPLILQEFVQKFPKPTFVQIGSATASELVKLGYYVNEMGVDTVLDLPEYSFAGKAMERIRYASNWLKKHGYSIAESTYSEADAQEAMAVSDGWRSGMKCRKSEMRFLNRPIRYEDELDVRKFFLRDASGRCVAFFYFDPMYRHGKVVGYATSIKRRLPEAPIYAEQGIMRAAVEKFKLEGIRQVNLGLSPLAWIENKTFRRNPFLHVSFRYAFRAWWVNRFFYNLEGHALYKRHFKGREEPFHYASPVLVNDLRIFHLMRLTGVC